MSISDLLSRLGGVRETGAGRWMALCPAHADRSPSLSVRELEDGRVLVHDFAGCEAGAVLDAVGLEYSDLYPKQDRSAHAVKQVRKPWSALQLMLLAEREIRVSTLIISDIVERRSVNQDDLKRLALAAGRLGVLVDEL